MAPEHCRYLPTHAWVKLDGTVARVGISDFAATEIKDVVFVDIPPAGTSVTAGKALGAIETVKAAFDLYAPLSGKIRGANAEVNTHPELVTKDPFGAGWMVEIEVADPGQASREMAALMDAAAYAAHCRTAKH